jgi:hypothetical protein
MRHGTAVVAIVVAAGVLPPACSGPAAPVEERAANVTLVERTWFDGCLKMQVPERFLVQDEMALHERFHLGLASVVALRSAAHTVEVVAILQKREAGAAEPEFKAPKEQLLRLVVDAIKQTYAAKQCLRDEIVTRDGRPICFFELAAASREGDLHVLCAYTFVGDVPLEVTFTCPEAAAGEWAALGARIVDSVVVSDAKDAKE